MVQMTGGGYRVPPSNKPNLLDVCLMFMEHIWKFSTANNANLFYGSSYWSLQSRLLKAQHHIKGMNTLTASYNGRKRRIPNDSGDSSTTFHLIRFRKDLSWYIWNARQGMQMKSFTYWTPKGRNGLRGFMKGQITHFHRWNGIKMSHIAGLPICIYISEKKSSY